MRRVAVGEYVQHDDFVFDITGPETDAYALMLLPIFPLFRRTKARVGVVQFRGHAVNYRIKILIIFSRLHQRQIALVNFLPFHAAELRIVIMRINIFPDFFKYLLWSLGERRCEAPLVAIEVAWPSIRTARIALRHTKLGSTCFMISAFDVFTKHTQTENVA